MRNDFPWTLFCAVALSTVVGCGDRDDGAGAGPSTGSNPPGDGSGDDSTDGGGPSGGDGDTSDGDEDPGSGGDGDTSDGGDGGGGDGVFIIEPDGGTAAECDVWNQDCPSGEKCVPWANDGGMSWNATKCSPVDMNPKQPGDTCTMEGNRWSGVDDCDVASMCWNTDDAGVGTCVSFCEGAAEAPTCSDPDTDCSITNEGVVILCLPVCDPLLQDCPGAIEACYPIEGGFQCAPDRSGDSGGAGDPCEFINTCDPGLFCAGAASTPGCSAIGCCSEFCDLTDSAGDAQCTGSSFGQVCTPAFAEGETPPGYEHVGYCIIPE